MVLPGGRHVDHDFFKVQVRKKGGRVDDVLLYLAYESLDAAHDRAERLLKEWQVDSAANRASLNSYRDYWRKKPNVFEDPNEDWEVDHTNGPVSLGIEVARTREPDGPFVVILAFGPPRESGRP